MGLRTPIKTLVLVTVLASLVPAFAELVSGNASPDIDPSALSRPLPTRRGFEKSVAAYVGDDLKHMSLYINLEWKGGKAQFDLRYGKEVDTRSILGGYPLSESFILAHRYKTKIVYVFLHGITDSAYQGKDLARDLHQAGANVMAVRLSGHGKDSGNVNSIELADWRDDVDQAVGRAKEFGENIVLIGLSTGAALVLDKAYRNPEEISGVVAVAPAIGIADPVARFVGMLGGFRWLAPIIPRIGAHNRDQTLVRQLQKGTHAVGILYELTQKLQRRIRRGKTLETPALFVTTSEDTAVQEKWIPRLLALSDGEWIRFVKDPGIPIGEYDVRKRERLLEILAAEVPSHSSLVFDRLEVPYRNGNPEAFENGQMPDPDNRFVNAHETNVHFSLVTRAIHSAFTDVIEGHKAMSCIEALMAAK